MQIMTVLRPLCFADTTVEPQKLPVVVPTVVLGNQCVKTHHGPTWSVVEYTTHVEGHK